MSKHLNTKHISDLVDLMLEIDCMKEYNDRTLVINELPKDRRNIKRNPLPNQDVKNIISKCNQHPGGMESLFQILDGKEGTDNVNLVNAKNFFDTNAVEEPSRRVKPIPPDPPWKGQKALLSILSIGLIAAAGFFGIKQCGETPTPTPTPPFITPTVVPTLTPTSTVTPTLSPPILTPLPTLTPTLPQPISIASATPRGCEGDTAARLKNRIAEGLQEAGIAGAEDLVRLRLEVAAEESAQDARRSGATLLYVWWQCTGNATTAVTVTFLAPPAYPVTFLNEPETVGLTSKTGDIELFVKGVAKYALGDYQSALKAFESLEVSPTSTTADGTFQWLKGNTLLRLGKPAGDAFRSASDAFEKTSPILKARVLANHGYMHLIPFITLNWPYEERDQTGCQDAGIPRVDEALSLDQSYSFTYTPTLVLRHLMTLYCSSRLEPSQMDSLMRPLIDSPLSKQDHALVRLLQAARTVRLGPTLTEAITPACDALKEDSSLIFARSILGFVHYSSRNARLALKEYRIYQSQAPIAWQQREASAAFDMLASRYGNIVESPTSSC